MGEELLDELLRDDAYGRAGLSACIDTAENGGMGLHERSRRNRPRFIADLRH
jgi:hypothetical protein